MSRSSWVIGLATVLHALPSFALAEGRTVVRPATVPDASFVIANPDLHWHTNRQGMTVADAVGDPDSTAHSNFIRMNGGTTSDLHRHSFDYYGVVVTGVVVNEKSASSPERRLTAGSVWYQKGNEPHVTKCVSSTECVFFVTSPGPFDYVSVPSH